MDSGGTVDKSPPASAAYAGSILVQKNSTCCGTTKPVCAQLLLSAPPEPMSSNLRAHVLQLLKLVLLEPKAPDKRSLP